MDLNGNRLELALKILTAIRAAAQSQQEAVTLPSGGAGQRGLQGPAGPQGPRGATGATGPRGSTGATGPRGPAGPTGPAGAQGPAGTLQTGQTLDSIIVGNHYHEYNMGVDLGTVGNEVRLHYRPARLTTTLPVSRVKTSPSVDITATTTLPTGPAGPAGSQGPTGATGPQGAQGLRGPQGPQIVKVRWMF